MPEILRNVIDQNFLKSILQGLQLWGGGGANCMGVCLKFHFLRHSHEHVVKT